MPPVHHTRGRGIPGAGYRVPHPRDASVFVARVGNNAPHLSTASCRRDLLAQFPSGKPEEAEAFRPLNRATKPRGLHARIIDNQSSNPCHPEQVRRQADASKDLRLFPAHHAIQQFTCPEEHSRVEQSKADIQRQNGDQLR
jgi:hypothetical protein